MLLRMNSIISFLASLNLAILMMGGVAILLGVGSFLTAPEESARLNSMPLFSWLYDTSFTSSWWLWGTIILLILLVLNTVICSIEALQQKAFCKRDILQRLAPHFMHAGFLFIVSAHFVSSSGGFKEVLQVREGDIIPLPDGRILIEKLDAQLGTSGTVADFSAMVATADGRHATARPNEPLFFGGIGIYIRQVELFPQTVGLLEIHREPGAWPALAGALLFAGGNLLVVARRRHPLAPPEKRQADYHPC